MILHTAAPSELNYSETASPQVRMWPSDTDINWQPSQAYYAFASAAGCDVKDAYLQAGLFLGNESKPIFQCLVEADSATLMSASAAVSQSGPWGTWAFLPVTDGRFIKERPSKQLLEGRVNGLNHLAGANALEGAAWVPPDTINTIDDLVHYLEVVLCLQTMTLPRSSITTHSTMLQSIRMPCCMLRTGSTGQRQFQN